MSSKSTVLITIALLAIACLIGFRYFIHNAYKAFPSGPTLDPKSGPYTQWKEFSAPSGKFNVTLPLMPQQASQTVTDPVTKQTRYYDMYVSQEMDGTSYMISAVTFQDKSLTSNPQLLMETILNDILKSNPENKLINSKFGQYNGMQAMDFIVKNPATTMQGKAFLDQQTLYILSSIENNQNYNQNDFDHFTKSFELKK